MMNRFLSSHYLSLLFTIVSVVTALAGADSCKIDIIVEQGLRNDPALAQKRIEIDNAALKKNSLRHGAILPKLEVSVGIGPAPAYTVREDSATGWFTEKYDFSDLKPLLATQVNLVQPLTFKRYQYGMDAANDNIELARSDVRKAEIELSQTLQKYYYKCCYALRMKHLTEDAKSTLKKAIIRAEDALDDENSEISQEDLLELKSYLYKANEILLQTERGIQTAISAIQFSTGSCVLDTNDTIFTFRTDIVPALDTLRIWQKNYHPDLQKLAKGLHAQGTLEKIAKLECLPDLYIGGSCTIARTIYPENQRRSGISRLIDPFDNTDAALGIGLRFPLNVWSTYDKVKKERLEMESLNRKEVFALGGTALQLENCYRELISYRSQYGNAVEAIRIADAWLSGAFLKYDLDQTQTRQLLKAYENYLQATKTLYDTILAHNLCITDLIATIGLTLNEYRNLTESHDRETLK